MTERESNVSLWPDFYDPLFFERKVGPGARIESTYAELLGNRPLRVVEAGCGTGDVLVELARLGHTIFGVEQSHDMVVHARKRLSSMTPLVSSRVKILEGEWESSDVPTDMDAVLLTNEFVLHAMTPQDLLTALSRSRECLCDGGLLALDVPDIDLDALASAAGKRREQELVRGYFDFDGEVTVRVSERVEFDPSSWRKEMFFRYEFIEASGRSVDQHFRRLVQRVWTTQEVEFAMRLAGFETVRRHAARAHPDRIFLVANKVGSTHNALDVGDDTSGRP